MIGRQQPHRVGAYKAITSPTNPLVKDLRALHLKKNRDTSGQFLAEGLQLVASGIEAGAQLRIFGYGDKMANHLLVQKLAARCKAHGGLVLQLSEAALGKISRRDNPQHVLGVFDQMWTKLAAVQAAESTVWIVLDRVRDPGNLGTIARTADAAGASGLILVGATCDPFSMEAVRATMGSVFSVLFVRASEDEFIKWAARWPGQIIGASLTGSEDYRTIEYREPALLLMGAEQSGLSGELAESCQMLARIPQTGRADSLNLAVSTGLMLYEMRREKLRL